MRNKKIIVLFIMFSVVTLLVFLSSVVFSVQEVNVHIKNTIDAELSAKIKENVKISSINSIFLVNEEQICEDVLSKVYNIDQMEVERIFPNKISINVVKLHEYAYIQDDQNFVISNNGKVIGATDDKKDKLIKLITSPIDNLACGQFINNSRRDGQVYAEIMTAFAACKYEKDVTEFIKFIDLTKNDFVYIQTHTGVMIKLMSRGNILDKIVLALSVYVREVDGSNYKNEGMIVVLDSDTSSSNVQHTKSSDYKAN